MKKPSSEGASTENMEPLLVWDNRTRRTVWFIMSKTKSILNISLTPVIATAFVILQSYFRATTDNAYKLLTLTCASLTFSCKLSENYRSINSVFSAIIRVCRSINSKAAREFLAGTNYNPDLSPPKEEIDLMQDAEISLMSALGFDFDIELPFNYIEPIQQYYITEIPHERQTQFVQQVQLDCCLVLCSENCLDVPPEVTAAAAVNETLKTQEYTHDDTEIENYIRTKYGSITTYELAINSIRYEGSRTTFRSSKFTKK